MAEWSCASCGRSSPEGMRFCGHCGSPRTEAAAPDTWACRDCGTPNLPAMAFCGGCGSKRRQARTEEVRLVTALFADLSGFTTLADRLAVEDLHDVIRPLVAGLARIAERYGGFIEKYAGDALLVVFGAPVTREDDAQRALLAALDMHAALPGLLADLGPDAAALTIHVGVNTGRVIAGHVGSEGSSDYAVLGDSVILAQRLESACPPGETYVGASTWALTDEEFELEPVGPLVLKGKLAPVEAYRLLGRRTTPRAARPLVGREAEVAAVVDGVTGGAVTTLVGEPGAGKTRLLAEVRRRLLPSGTAWLAARCLSYGSALAYWPLADLLRRELADQSPEELLPAEALPGARRLLGLVSGGEPEAARREVRAGIAAWLRSRGPAVLVLEDLHWADRSSVELLAELVRTGEVAVSLLLVTREEGRAAADEVAGEAAAAVVELGPLDDDALAGVVGTVVEGGPAPALLDLVADRTEGNPLHAVELARSLSESGALVRTVAGWDLRPGYDAASVPSTVERVYAARLDALPPPVAGLLQVASVVGRTVRLPLLRAVEGDVEAGLQQLVDAGMLDRSVDGLEPAVVFSHALLQDVVYSRLLRRRRRELHRRVADAARELYGDGDDVVALLARHLHLADAGAEAVEPLLRAGRRAAGLYAHDEAAVHLERAVEVLERLEDERLAEVELELAEVQQLRGSYDRALELYERAVALTGAPEAWRGRAAVLRCQGRYADALGVFVEALRQVDARSPSAAGLWLEAGLVLAGQGRSADAVSTLLTGLRLLPSDDRVQRGRLLTRLAHVRSTVGPLSTAEAEAADAARLLEDGPLPDLVKALRVLGTVHLYAGAHDDAEQALERAYVLAERAGVVEESAGCSLNLGLVEMERGRPEQAAERYRLALARFERIGNEVGRAHALGNLAEALSRTPEQAAAWDCCERALQLAGRIGQGLVIADVTRTRAVLLAAKGRPDDAAETALAAASSFLEQGVRKEAEDCVQLALAQASSLDADRARDLSSRARSLLSVED